MGDLAAARGDLAPCGAVRDRAGLGLEGLLPELAGLAGHQLCEGGLGQLSAVREGRFAQGSWRSS